MELGQIWIVLKSVFSVVIASAYMVKVAEDGHKKTHMPGMSHFAHYAISFALNIYIATLIFSNTKLDVHYNSDENVNCTIGFYAVSLKKPHEIAVTSSKVESVDSAMWWFYVSKMLRLLDSFTLLSRETDKAAVMKYAVHRVMAMMLSGIAVRFLAGDINAVYLAAISASVSGCAYAIYALAVARLACSDEYFEEPGVDVKIEKFCLGMAYLGYACYFFIYHYMNQGKCGSPWWALAVVFLYLVVMGSSWANAPERENGKKGRLQSPSEKFFPGSDNSQVGVGLKRNVAELFCRSFSEPGIRKVF